MAISQDEYDVTLQTERELYAKIVLTNLKFQPLDELSGVVVGFPSFTIDTDSDLRRSCSIEITPTDSSFDISYGNKIWLDKCVQIFMGIKSTRTQEIIYTNMGYYLINNPSQVYTADSNTITIDGVDLMALLTGMRNGSLEGYTYQVPADTNIRTAIIGTLKEAGITNYSIPLLTETVPNTISIDVGGTYYDILSTIRDLYPNYVMYFDVNGIFTYKTIPYGYNDPVVANDDLWNNTLISYSIDNNFENIKNSITVIGRTHEIADGYYGGTVTSAQYWYGSGKTDFVVEYSVTISGVTSVANLATGTLIGFTTSYGGNAIKINNDTDFSYIENSKGYKTYVSPSKTGESEYLIFEYMGDKIFKFLGGITPRSTVQETNPHSQFYVGNEAGEIRTVLSGGEYDNCYSQELTDERARWELYTRCRLSNTVQLTTAPIYWLDVDQLIEITLPTTQGNSITATYIITHIDIGGGGVDSTETITAMRYYPYYSNTPSLVCTGVGINYTTSSIDIIAQTLDFNSVQSWTDLALLESKYNVDKKYQPFYLPVTYGNNMLVFAEEDKKLKNGDYSTENYVYRSTDINNFTPSTTVFENSFSDITYGNNLFVATNFNYDDYSAFKVYYSTDADIWYECASSFPTGFYSRSISYNPQNKTFVLTGHIRNITGTTNQTVFAYYSQDGIHWLQSNTVTGFSYLEKDNCWSYTTSGDGVFVILFQELGATTSGYKTTTFTSTDGITWTQFTQELQGASMSVGLSYANHKFYYTLFEEQYPFYYFNYANGDKAWSLCNLSSDMKYIYFFPYKAVYYNSKYWTVDGNTGGIAQSDDGINWSLYFTGTPTDRDFAIPYFCTTIDGGYEH